MILHPDLLDTWSEDESLPQALLIAGPTGIGKRAFAQALARRIIGIGEDVPAHPDLIVVGPNEELKTRPIDVETIRGLVRSLALTSGGQRVALVLEADRMNPSAANALLKALEEPPAGTRIILTAIEPWKLPITIRSRLQVRALPKPLLDEALAYINEEAPEIRDAEATRLIHLAGGAPMAALALKETGVDQADTIAALAAAAIGGKFPRERALQMTQKAGDAGFSQASQLVLRFLHLVGLAAAGAELESANEAEREVARKIAAKSGPAKAADAWRAAAELKRQAETQNLAKSWILYRMCLAIEWVAA